MFATGAVFKTDKYIDDRLTDRKIEKLKDGTIIYKKEATDRKV